MPADNVLAEALARIEHKLDLLLHADRGNRLHANLPALGSQALPCPVCNQPVLYQVDQINKVVTRVCGCKTGLQAPLDLNAFAPPAQAQRKEDPNGAREDREDGSNPNPRGGRPVR
jgi:hypothetical protein